MITPVQLLRRIRERKGFTLVEVIVASSVFVAVSIIGVTVFVNVMRIQRRIILENAIYEDARFMIERIARDIRYNTIDYEEYYRAAEGTLLHGENFGCYAERFYNPGSDTVIGALCNDATPLVPGCVVNKNTLDVNTGQNPYIQDPPIASTAANALCDQPNHGDINCSLGSSEYSVEQSQLFLINPEGTEKTYIGRKQVNSLPPDPEHAVALLKLTGQDNDKDGIAEDWYDVPPASDYEPFCSAGFDCPAATITNLDDNLDGTEGGVYQGFVPFTPLRTDVTQLRFYISPVEDPRKAFAETITTEEIQQQPHVTVVMTVKPAVSELQGFAGDPPEVTIQTTITSRTYNEVKSYLGKPRCP